MTHDKTMACTTGGDDCGCGAADDLIERLAPDYDTCPFCGHDPFHCVDNGIGMERVAVTCCELGIALYQHGDDQLVKEVALRREAAAKIEADKALIAELVEALSALVDEFGCTIEQYDKNGPDFTHKDGTEVFHVSSILDRRELVELARAALSKAKAGPS